MLRRRLVRVVAPSTLHIFCTRKRKMYYYEKVSHLLSYVVVVVVEEVVHSSRCGHARYDDAMNDE